MSTQRFFCEGLEDFVVRDDNESVVMAGHGYNIKGEIRCHLKNTGNGYIAHFPSHSSSYQDNYVCIDYDQAQALVMALSAFKKELGFE